MKYAESDPAVRPCLPRGDGTPKILCAFCKRIVLPASIPHGRIEKPVGCECWGHALEQPGPDLTGVFFRQQ